MSLCLSVYHRATKSWYMSIIVAIMLPHKLDQVLGHSIPHKVRGFLPSPPPPICIEYLLNDLMNLIFMAGLLNALVQIICM